MSRLTQHDRRLLKTNPIGIVGVDEAGRGCLAGPVSAAAVWIDWNLFGTRDRRRLARRANDSKKLSPAQRDELFAAVNEWCADGVVRVAHAYASVLEIDAYNILGATRLAMHRCLQQLADAARSPENPTPFADASTGADDTPLFPAGDTAHPLVLVDGRPLKPFVWRHTALIAGDSRSLAIALASIVAKVTRDRFMNDLDARFPEYGFATHKGYATPEHIAALRRHGACAEHRPLFLRSILAAPAAETNAQTEFAFAI
jgi:ribonuclease HII